MMAFNDNDTAPQQSRGWSAQLGEQAAQLTSASPQGAIEQSRSNPGFPTRLSAVLAHFAGRNRRQQHAANQLRVNEFMIGD
jgi:hypothetical protein